MNTLMLRKNLSDDAANWIGTIDALGATLAGRREYSEQNKATDPEVMGELFKAGLGKLSIPKAFGGRQVPLATITEILQTLSKYDASVSWQVAVQVAMGRLADYLPEEAAHAIYSDTRRFVIGAIHAGGTAIPEKDGYRLSGQWTFASGSPHADWLVCTAVVQNDDPAAAQETRMFFVPAGQCQILDTWDTLGMRGTGSNDFTCKDVWIDKKLSVDAGLLKYRPKERSTLAYSTGYYDFGTIAAMATVYGIAKSALEFFRDNRKKPLDPNVNPVIDEKVGRSLSLLYSARLLLDDAVEQASVPNDGSLVGTHPRVSVAAATMTENSLAAMNQIYTLAGAGGVYKRNFLEHCFRDIHTGSKHFTLSPLNFYNIGNAFLDKQ
ncbi:oxidoreductase [Burkholderia ubonensis]|uniref:acyl-CoA dehydrogenase family protein n=1 Tax=Burkholderia ubonensis TaxID=101571 RepID=UPI000759290D|nr:acyl-CoA dehydrogenase family protein [Burkholderia ubonensis]KVT83085.1 oxidoreductase [Burkholderia ubonensis]